jgi:sugar phosphate isomerase/epimerase
MNPDFTPFAINHPQSSRQRKARDWFKKSLEYAGVLGCSHLTALPGVRFEEESRAESLNRAAQELAWHLDLSREAGITFAGEAHVGSIALRPRSVLALLEKVPGHDALEHWLISPTLLSNT